jgi:CubicO group peptidase (beta-lactamase class C family)
MNTDRSILKAFAEEMRRRCVRLHGAVLLRGGEVIEEIYNPPYDRNTKTRMYSASKSVTALAIGKLIGEGRLSLDTRLVDIFAGRFDTDAVHPLLKEQTVEDMLRMTTVYSSATYSEHNTDWLASYFRGVPTHPAGTLWHYDSCGSYVLGAVVKQITGLDFVGYLRPELDVLGVSPDVFCLSGPDGEAWASSGFIATTADIARIAYLYLNGGRWGDRQLVPEKFARDATSPLSTNYERGIISRFCCGYGYQIWSHPDGAFAFRGLGGQVAIGFPGRDLVFACNCDTAANATTYDDIFYAVEELILPHFEITDRDAYGRAQPHEVTQNVLEDIIGTTYRMQPNSMGIDSVSFSALGNLCRLRYTQGENEYDVDFSVERETRVYFPKAYTGKQLFSKEHYMSYFSSVEARWLEPRKLMLQIWAEDLYVGNCTLFFYFKEDGRIAMAAKKHAQFFFTEFNGYAYGIPE